MTTTDRAPGTGDPEAERGATTAPVRRAGLRATLRLVRPHLRPNWRLLVAGLAGLLAEIALRVLEPWPTKIVVDAVTGTGVEPPLPLLPLLVVMAAATVVLAVGRAATDYLATVSLALAGSRTATSLRSAVFDHVVALSLRQLGRLRTGDLVTRLVGDVGRLQEIAITAGMPLVVNVATTIVMLLVILVVDPLLALVTLVAIGAFVVMSRRGSPAITEAAARTRRAEGDLATQVAESVGAMHVVQAFRLERLLGASFRAANDRALGDGVRATRLSAGLERRTDVVAAIAVAIVLGVGGWRVTTGSISVGDLVLFLTYLRSALKPLRDVAKYGGRIAKAHAAADRIADLVAVTPEIVDRPGAARAPRLVGAIALEEVTLEYVPGHPVLRGVSLAIAPGERVALVGPSGGGKTSIASLVLRLVDPVAGAVRLDGTDLRDLTIDSVRAQVAFMPQEPILFAVSIRENIRYGQPEATDAEVVEAARAASADDFIRRLPSGYETVVGERGATLSGGQRQRVALARALLRDAPIVILDEATSSIDPESAAEIRRSIQVLAAGATLLVITHDVESPERFDRAVWVEDGGIVDLPAAGARGTIRELITAAESRA